MSCTNSRHSDIRAPDAVFREAAKTNGDVVPKIADGIKLYLAAASSREQEAAEDHGDWQVLLRYPKTGLEEITAMARDSRAPLRVSWTIWFRRSTPWLTASSKLTAQVTLPSRSFLVSPSL